MSKGIAMLMAAGISLAALLTGCGADPTATPTPVPTATPTPSHPPSP